MMKNNSSVRSAAAKQASKKFLADAMLGSLARKLRILGFDTEYLANANDEEVLRRGTEEGRVILTADEDLFKRTVKQKTPVVLIKHDGDLEKAVQVLSHLGLTLEDVMMGSRCTICNGLLDPITSQEVSDVPQGIRERYSQFYKCTTCGKAYWDGSHMRQMSAFAQKLRERLTKG